MRRPRSVVRAFLPVAIALTTTAFGTLVPILREGGLLEGRLGGFLLAAGADPPSWGG